MEIINPNEIGTKISTLKAESTKYFFAVTPFIKIIEWKKILVNLDAAVKRKVKIVFYVKKINTENLRKLKKLGIDVLFVDDLHTKLYLNQSKVIVSSMNLYEYSDLHSKDLALSFDDPINHADLYRYFDKYIRPHGINKLEPEVILSKLEILRNALTNSFTKSKITLANNEAYLFSQNLIPIFHFFLDQRKITLKHPQKNLSEKFANNFSKTINEKCKIKIEVKKPTDNYRYYIWDIIITEYSDFEIIALLSNLRDIVSEFDSY